MKKILLKIYWWITDRCKFCGGEVETWDNFESFNCSRCGKSQNDYPVRCNREPGIYLTFEKNGLEKIEGVGKDDSIVLFIGYQK